MQDFLRDFPGARLVRLEENYRSTQVVLDAANGVIAENKGRIGKTLTTRRKGGETVTVLAAADERDEAEWIVRELQRRSAGGDWRYGEMAVLYRTNAQSRALEEAFRRAGVPYRLVGAISFYERREVKDLLAYLRLVANPADDEAFLRAIAIPRRGLGETSLATLGRSADAWSHPLLETARIADRVPELRPNVREAFRSFAASSTGWPRGLAAGAGRGAGAGRPCHRLRVGAAGRRTGGGRPLGERPRADGQRGQLVGGSHRRSGWYASRAIPRGSGAARRGRHGRRPRGWRHDDDAAHRQGPRVAGGGAHRDGAGSLPARARRGAARRARGGAPPLLRRTHPGQGQAVPELGAGPPPRRRAASGHPRRAFFATFRRASSRSVAPPRSGRRTGAPGRAGGAPDAPDLARRPTGYANTPSRRAAARPLRRKRSRRTRRAMSKASGCATGGSAAAPSRDSPAPAGISRCRSRSTTPRSA